MPFTCSICGEESTRICVRCTKDACNNHICEKCLRCSDCCECEVALSEPVHETVRMVVRATPVEAPDDEVAPDEVAHESVTEAGPEPEPHIPGPDPDPEPLPAPEEPRPTGA